MLSRFFLQLRQLIRIHEKDKMGFLNSLKSIIRKLNKILVFALIVRLVLVFLIYEYYTKYVFVFVCIVKSLSFK